MNAPVEPLPWSRRQWLGLITGAFLAHIGLICFLGEHPPRALPPPPPFQATLAESLAPMVAGMADFDDPALFALSSPRGFSGRAWLQWPQFPHQYREWAEEQRWLALPVDDLGEVFVKYVRDTMTQPLAMSEKPVPPLAAPEVERPAWLAVQSSLRVEGALTTRKMLHRPALPNWPRNEVLERSTVQAVVDERGRVISAILLTESGLPAADQAALHLTRELVFDKLTPPAGLTMGKLIFDWHTVPPTNGNGGKP